MRRLRSWVGALALALVALAGPAAKEGLCGQEVAPVLGAMVAGGKLGSHKAIIDRPVAFRHDPHPGPPPPWAGEGAGRLAPSPPLPRSGGGPGWGFLLMHDHHDGAGCDWSTMTAAACRR